MELNLRTVLVILGSIIMLGILVDGFRRMRRARKDALSIDVNGDFKFPEDSFPSELPNGGGRVIADVNAEDLLKDAKNFRDQLDDLPVMSALDSLEENAEKSLDENIKISMKEDRIYPGEPDFQHDSYSEHQVDSPLHDDEFKPDQHESKPKEFNEPKESGVTSKAHNISEDLKQDLQKNSDGSVAVQRDSEMDSAEFAPKAKPLNLDQHVPLLTDVEELGDDMDAHDEFMVEQAHEAANPATNTEENIELTFDDIEGINAAVGDISDLLVVNNDVSENCAHADDHPQAQDMMAQAAYAPVKQPGPNAEVLSERPAPSLVLVTHVVPHDEDGFCGEDILYLVNSCDLRHGEKGIFHRFEQEGGEGCIEFSMANSFNPGTFDPNTLIHERIHGISLFMSLPGPMKAMNAFESMTEMASVIARNLGGDVHDETHSIMALQTIEHNRQLVRDFVRKQKLTEKK